MSKLLVMNWLWFDGSDYWKQKKGKGKDKGKGMEHFLFFLSKPLKKEHDIFRIIAFYKKRKKNDMLRIEAWDTALMAVTF